MERRRLSEGFAALLSSLEARPVFVDTGAFYSVQTQADRNHQNALRAWGVLVARGTPLVTTNAVVGEAYTLFRDRRGYRAAWGFLGWLDSARSLFRHHVTEALEIQAYAILRQYQDQNFSFVDGTSFAFMHSMRITEAFAFDAHFATAGFTRIPLDRPLS
jgi:predicted nucleic acid-binding protein